MADPSQFATLMRAAPGAWLLVSLGAPAAPVSEHVDAASGMKRWTYEGDGLAIELVQVPPDFIRASFAARDIPAEVAESVARRCVFGTIVRNTADTPLAYRVAEWRHVLADGTEHPIKTKSEWLAEWHGMGVRFSWAILADDAEFAVGDWIQGFTTMPAPHGSRVNLKVVWTIAGVRHEQLLPNLECAPAPDA